MAGVAIGGAAGRMGKTLIASVSATDDLEVTVALEHPGNAAVGIDAGVLAGVGAISVAVVDSLEAEIDAFDVLIDFSIPSATVANAALCARAAKGMVIGTTGLSPTELESVEEAARVVPIMMAPNMSVGVNAAFKLIEMAALILGDEVDVEVFEAHHRHKIDAPSGTAVRMGEVLARALGRDLEVDAVYGREGETGARERRTIGFHSLRGGDIVGDHTVTFAGTGERIEITHRAASRENFAAGALRGVRFVHGREPGFYGMDDVLGL